MKPATLNCKEKKVYFISLIAIAFSLNVEQTRAAPDPVGLAIAIVDAVRADAGLTPNAEVPARASGPFTVRHSSFAHEFTMAFGQTTAAEVTQALSAEGYPNAELDSLVITGADAAGYKTRSLANDALLMSLRSLEVIESDAFASVVYFFTRGSIVCPRYLRFELRETSGVWSVTTTKVEGECIQAVRSGRNGVKSARRPSLEGRRRDVAPVHAA
jgi:hypothetical protein